MRIVSVHLSDYDRPLIGRCVVDDGPVGDEAILRLTEAARERWCEVDVEDASSPVRLLELMRELELGEEEEE